ncbi:phosphatidylinositol kinase [Paenibacillus agilis]|uniref:Phosphatidylinositol kinase n=1 Tax=Paenibacillus agilis TaxID=3020863 RepID=A0A559IZM3_9BACL|nr:phosphatidylinositol kinase [Paenibacillus agilis]TVX93079.1 phosphatidylinositol kinase [Paenibacillus agilis]
MDQNFLKQACWNSMNKYVGIQTNDGQSHDGFIAHVDENYVTLAIPTNEVLTGKPTENSANRQFGFHPGFFPRRRFFFRRFPFPFVTSLFLLPFFI